MYFNSPSAAAKRDEVRVGLPLPNTIEIADGTSSDTKRERKKEKDLRFICVGSLQPAKGQDRVLEFMENLLKKYDRTISLTFAGEGILMEQLVRKAEKLKKKYPHFDCRFTGLVEHDKIGILLSQSDIYIMLHRVSIFDMATLEAMSKGLAVVLSDVGGNRDFDTDGGAVLLVKSGQGDSLDYNGAVNKLLSTDLNMLKKQCKELFLTKFTPENFRKNYHSLMDTIIKENK